MLDIITCVIFRVCAMQWVSTVAMSKYCSTEESLVLKGTIISAMSHLKERWRAPVIFIYLFILTFPYTLVQKLRQSTWASIDTMLIQTTRTYTAPEGSKVVWNSLISPLREKLQWKPCFLCWICRKVIIIKYEYICLCLERKWKQTVSRRGRSI